MSRKGFRFDGSKGSILWLLVKGAQATAEGESLSQGQALKWEGMQLHANPDQEEAELLPPYFLEWQSIQILFSPGLLEISSWPHLQVDHKVLRGEYIPWEEGKGVYQFEFPLAGMIGPFQWNLTVGDVPMVWRLEGEIYPNILSFKEDFQDMVLSLQGVLLGLGLRTQGNKMGLDSFAKPAAYSLGWDAWEERLKKLAQSWYLVEQHLEVGIQSEKGVEQTSRAKRPLIRQSPHLNNPDSLRAMNKILHPNTLANQRALDALGKVMFQLGQPDKWLNPLMPAEAKQKWVSTAQRWRRRLAAGAGRYPWRSVSRLPTRPHYELPPTYQRFERQALALFNDLTLAQAQTSRYRWHDTPLLYEQWVFWYLIQFLSKLSGVKLLPLSHTLIQAEAANKDGFLFRRGAYVECELTEQGEKVGIWYNRKLGAGMPGVPSTRPDIVLERWRPGQKVPLRWLLEVKYQVQMEGSLPGPPRSAFAQLHRYRDAAVSDLSWENNMRTAVKAQGGLVIFPGEVDEELGREMYWYKSLTQVGIGAMPLKPGAYRDRRLFEDWFKQWLGLPQSKLWEQRIEYKTNS